MNNLSSQLDDGLIFQAYDTEREVRVEAYDDRTLDEPYLTVSVSRLDAATTRNVVELDVHDAENLMVTLGAWLHRQRTWGRS